MKNVLVRGLELAGTVVVFMVALEAAGYAIEGTKKGLKHLVCKVSEKTQERKEGKGA